jgi:TLC domain
MCKPTEVVDNDNDGAPAAASQSNGTAARTKDNNDDGNPNHPRRKLQVLLSLDSFRADSRGRPPARSSVLLTVAVWVAALFASELLFRHLLAHPRLLPHLPSCLWPQHHRHILARHVGVDALACALCSLLGYTSSLWQSNTTSKPSTTSTTTTTTMEQRLLTYHPEGVRTATVFLAYQVKNLHDSYVWDDGAEFLAHHVFSIVTAWGCLYPGCGHYYAVFFFGVSEISTAVLCLLANFDPTHGVPGLDVEYPLVKVALGAAFVALFVLCRCILWPMYSYRFGRDVLHALRVGSDGGDPRTEARKYWMYFFLVSLGGLSVLQVAWLGQIFLIAQEELAKMGWIGV